MSLWQDKSENKALITPNAIAPYLPTLRFSCQYMLSVRKLQVPALPLRNYVILGKSLSFMNFIMLSVKWKYQIHNLRKNTRYCVTFVKCFLVFFNS